MQAINSLSAVNLANSAVFPYHTRRCVEIVQVTNASFISFQTPSYSHCSKLQV